MACEKCWSDAYIRHMNNPQKSQAEHYVDLLEERKHAPRTLAQERGQFGKAISEANGSGDSEVSTSAQ